MMFYTPEFFFYKIPTLPLITKHFFISKKNRRYFGFLYILMAKFDRLVQIDCN
jgi:hypothetical protein